MFSFGASQNINPNNDIISNECPSNITSVAVNGYNQIAGSSWEGDICVWAITNNSLQGKSQMKASSPFLDCDWAGNYVVGASTDKSGWLWDPVSNQKKQFANHSAPIRKIKTSGEDTNIIATGSWDSTVKFWDIRKQGECLTCDTKERVYAMDCKKFVLAVGVAEKGMLIFDIRKPNTPVKTFLSPLRLQTRSVSIFKELDGVCIGAIEGRISVTYFESESQSFNFKAHREKPVGKINEVASAVNDIAFHPKHGTFMTCGSDGMMLLWDKKAKQKIKTYQKMPEPIVSACFNNDGTIFVYAMSYDYSQGNDNKKHESKVYVKNVPFAEMQPK